MAEESPKTEQKTALTKAEAVKAWYDAKTPQEKAAVVAANQSLKGVFSEANH